MRLQPLGHLSVNLNAKGIRRLAYSRFRLQAPKPFEVQKSHRSAFLRIFASLPDAFVGSSVESRRFEAQGCQAGWPGERWRLEVGPRMAVQGLITTGLNIPWLTWINLFHSFI